MFEYDGENVPAPLEKRFSVRPYWELLNDAGDSLGPYQSEREALMALRGMDMEKRILEGWECFKRAPQKRHLRLKARKFVFDTFDYYQYNE